MLHCGLAFILHLNNKDIIITCWFNNINTSPDHRVCLNAIYLLHNEAFKQTMYSKPEIAVHVQRPSQTG